jgi:hypothetical protein
MKQATLQQPLLSNSSTNKQVSTAAVALQQRNSVFCVLHAKILCFTQLNVNIPICVHIFQTVHSILAHMRVNPKIEGN